MGSRLEEKENELILNRITLKSLKDFHSFFQQIFNEYPLANTGPEFKTPVAHTHTRKIKRK
jgi:hypothetical protein